VLDLDEGNYGSHALTHRNRTGKPNESCVLLMTV
jgi:hypothetical protein